MLGPPGLARPQGFGPPTSPLRTPGVAARRSPDAPMGFAPRRSASTNVIPPVARSAAPRRGSRPAPERGSREVETSLAFRRRRTFRRAGPESGGLRALLAGHLRSAPPTARPSTTPLTRPAPVPRRGTTPERAVVGAVSGDRGCRPGLRGNPRRVFPAGPAGARRPVRGAGPARRPCGALVAARGPRRFPCRREPVGEPPSLTRSGPPWRRARGAVARRRWPFVAFGRSTDARFGAAVRDMRLFPVLDRPAPEGAGGTDAESPGRSLAAPRGGTVGWCCRGSAGPPTAKLLGARPGSRPRSIRGKPRLA
jgi:hypothetical protein